MFYCEESIYYSNRASKNHDKKTHNYSEKNIHEIDQGFIAKHKFPFCVTETGECSYKLQKNERNRAKEH